MIDKKKIEKFSKIEEVEKYYQGMFQVIQKKMHNVNDFEFSGTSAICVLIIDKKIYCIYMGNLCCVLEQKKDGQIVDLKMSNEHIPSRDIEKKRIEKKGGEVIEKISGEAKIFKKNNDKPGLIVSRSIGDTFAHLHCGVIPDPEVYEKTIGSDDVLGSKGIWDVISPSKVVKFINEKIEEKDKECNTNTKSLSELLVERCRQLHEIETKKIQEENELYDEINWKPCSICDLFAFVVLLKCE